MSRRQEIIEPRFGQIKQHEGFRRWTVWGLDNVRTQWVLLGTTLNLRILYRRWRAGHGPHVSSAATALSQVADGLKKVRAGVVAVWPRARTRRRNPEARTATHAAWPLAPSVLRLTNYF